MRTNVPFSRLVLLSGLAALLPCGCMNLDSFMFGGEDLAEYQTEEYTGESECGDALDTLGPIEASQVVGRKILSGGEVLGAYLLSGKPALGPTDTLLLYLHGKSLHIDYYWPRTRLLHATGYPVLVIDYRGYGTSTGKPTEEGIEQDGWAALDFVRDSLGDPYVCLYGYSLGSLAACELASRPAGRKIASLALEAPIGKVETIVQDATYLDIPAPYVTSFTGDNVERIRHVTVPLLWLHGTSDEKLPLLTHGQPIWDNYAGSQGFCAKVPGAGHRTIPQHMGYAKYVGCVKDFVGGRGSANPLLTPR